MKQKTSKHDLCADVIDIIQDMRQVHERNFFTICLCLLKLTDFVSNFNEVDCIIIFFIVFNNHLQPKKSLYKF